jgi:hypothetical protein
MVGRIATGEIEEATPPPGDGKPVTNDVSRRYFPTIGLGELVRDPFSRWVRGHSQPQGSQCSARLVNCIVDHIIFVGTRSTCAISLC